MLRPDRQTTFSAIAVGLSVLLLAVLLGGCQVRDRSVLRSLSAPVGPDPNMARLNVFLTLDEKQGPAIRLEIDKLEALVDDLWLPISSGPFILDSLEIGNGQLFLGGTPVPPGLYQGLRLTVTGGRLETISGRQKVTLSEPRQIEMTSAKGLKLESGDSKTLLLTWDVEGSLNPQNALIPKFFVVTAMRNLPANLVFAACPEINTVFVVRADKNWVTDSFGLTGGPSYLAILQASRHERFYVLTPDEKMVKVVDSSSYRVVDAYPTLNDYVSYMTTSPDGQWAFLVHQQSGYLSRMNLQTGQIDPRIRLGNQPNFALYLEPQRLLAVSLGLTETVLLLDPETLRVVRTISTGSNPEGLLVSDNVLYVADSGDASVTATELANSGAQGRQMVGFGPRRLMDSGDQIFVSNYKDGSLSVLLPGQLGAVQEIYGLGEPFEMVFDQFYRKLYVADQREAALAVIDVNSNQLVRQISLGATPVGLAVIQ